MSASSTYGIMILFSLLLLLGRTVIGQGVNNSDRQYAAAPNTYDILNFVYRLCAADSDSQIEGLDCLDYHLGTETADAFVLCINKGIEDEEREIQNAEDALNELCNNRTTVRDWKAKHKEPPFPITKVIGLSALQHIVCVLEDGPRMPFPRWQMAFAQCFTSSKPLEKKAKADRPLEQNLGR